MSGAAAVIAARRVRDKARLIAGSMLEVAPEDLVWEKGRFEVRGVPGSAVTLQ